MSNLNVLNSIDAQLFTELSAEQAAIVEGGNTLRIVGIQCLVAGADVAGADNTYMKFGSEKIWSGDMHAGDYKSIDKLLSYDGTARIHLFDSDGWFTGEDDYLGSFNVGNENVKGKVVTVQGGGSMYEVTYNAAAIDV